MKKLSIFSTKNQVYLYDGLLGEEIFNLKEYQDIFKKDFQSNHKLFDRIVNDYQITDIEDIKENFLYLFNVMLISNVTNYIVDRYEHEEFQELVFDQAIEKSKTTTIRYNELLEIDDFLGGVIIALFNSESYLEKGMKMDYGVIQNKRQIEADEKKGLEFFMNYQNKNIEELKEKLKVDLIAFGYGKKGEFNEEGRYMLPVYVDYDGLAAKNLQNFEEFLPNWMSIAYLNMLIKTYDFFADYYNIEASDEELETDDLMVALISMLDYEERPIPSKLNRSIEVGRQTAGKCYIIDTVQRPISLPGKLALTLQAKDIFSVVPSMCLTSI